MVASLLVLAALAVVAVWVDRRAAGREASGEAAFPPLGQFVTLSDGTRVHALVRGSGPDLVLIHGAGGNTREFTFDMVADLSTRYRIIALDRPGHGYTEQPPGFGGLIDTTGESPARQAEMLSEAAALLGADSPIVLGNSFGGAVALAWALDHDAAAVVSFAGVSHPWDTGLDWTYHANGSSVGGAILTPMVTAFVTEGLIADGLKKVFAPNPVPDGYRDHFGPELTLRRASQRASARQVLALSRHMAAQAPRYGELTLPIEVLHGQADTVVDIGIHARALIATAPSANLTALPASGHMPHHADRTAAIAAIDRAATRAGLR